MYKYCSEQKTRIVLEESRLSYREQVSRDQNFSNNGINEFLFCGEIEEKPKEIAYSNYTFISFKLLVPTDRPNGTTGKNAAHIPLTANSSLAPTLLPLNIGDMVKVKGEVRTKDVLSKDGATFSRPLFTVKKIEIV